MAEFRVLLNDIDVPDIELWETYVANGGYAAAEIAVRRRSPGEVLDLIEQSGLQDRGGDWYSVAARWRNHAQKRAGSGAEFLCVGGNESEPGTFRDRKLLERNPHQILEGIIIAAYTLHASTVYVCLRSDMNRGRVLLEQAIASAREHGWLGANVRETGYALEVSVYIQVGTPISRPKRRLSCALSKVSGRNPVAPRSSRSSSASRRRSPISVPWHICLTS